MRETIMNAVQVNLNKSEFSEEDKQLLFEEAERNRPEYAKEGNFVTSLYTVKELFGVGPLKRIMFSDAQGYERLENQNVLTRGKKYQILKLKPKVRTHGFSPAEYLVDIQLRNDRGENQWFSSRPFRYESTIPNRMSDIVNSMTRNVDVDLFDINGKKFGVTVLSVKRNSDFSYDIIGIEDESKKYESIKLPSTKTEVSFTVLAD
jgi:hypothetical protein